MIHIVLPVPLQQLARAPAELELNITGTATANRVIDALEAQYPALRGTVRDTVRRQRRPYMRFFACSEDISLKSLDDPLPEAVADGRAPLLIVGAIAGG